MLCSCHNCRPVYSRQDCCSRRSSTPKKYDHLYSPWCLLTPVSCKRGNFGDSAINKGYIAYFSMHMRMRETALFLLPVWNLTSPSCSSTTISCMTQLTREFRRFSNIQSRNWHIYVCMVFLDPLAQNGSFGVKVEEGVVRCWPPVNAYLLLGWLPLFHFWRKLIKKCDRESADSHSVTEANWIYNLSQAKCYSLWADNYTSLYAASQFDC